MRSAQMLSTPRIKRKKETLNVLLFTEKTRIRNDRRTSKHFPTTKVDFLKIKVVLRITRTITSETQLMTSKPRVNVWPTDIGLICNFPFLGGDGVGAALVRSDFKPLYLGNG